MTFDLGMYIKQQVRDMNAFGVLDYIENREEEIEKLKEENARLNQQVKDLKDFAETLSEEHANEWEQQQNIISKMRCCENCEDYSKQYEATGCPDCIDLSHWRIKA